MAGISPYFCLWHFSLGGRAARDEVQLISKKSIPSIKNEVQQESHNSESAQECPNSPAGFAGRQLSGAMRTASASLITNLSLSQNVASPLNVPCGFN